MTAVATAAEVFATYVDRLNASDVDGVMELFDSTVVVPEVIQERFGTEDGTGHAAARNYITTTVVGLSGKLDVLRIATSGEWAYGVLTIRNALATNLGLARIRGIDELHVVGGRIVEFRFIPDTTDNETATYFQAVANASAD